MSTSGKVMRPLEVWNRRGAAFPLTRGAEKIEALVKTLLLPGTAVEGEWISSEGALYLFDVTYKGETRRKWEEMKGSDIESDSEELAEGLPEAPEGMSRIRRLINQKMPYHFPPAPKKGSKSILTFPPDDWCMEKKMDGDRALVFQQLDDNYVSLDVRTVPYDDRRSLLENLVQHWNHPYIRVVDKVDNNFTKHYEDWKRSGNVEGIVMKKRNSHYISSSIKPTEVNVWIKRRFKSD